jgi:quinol monooxygenase YgiN
MATLLVHIRVRPGMEARFEELAAELFRATHETERAVRRYEYFRGTDPSSYYALLSFDDYHSFLEHQSSDHHEAAGPGLGEVTESMRVEWVDPIQRASPLRPTDHQPLPDDASAVARRYHERFGDITMDWWRDLRGGTDDD